MASAKDLVLRPISAQEANALVRRVHYSQNTLNNSQVHLGVFWAGRLEGAIQLGPPMDRRKTMALVDGARACEVVELNRMAFTDALPRNSESRALSVAMRLLRKHAPQLRWVVSFADATQCGDGTIYRAAGFVLTGIKPNDQIWRLPDGLSFTRLVATNLTRPKRGRLLARVGATEDGRASMAPFVRAGAECLPGFQLRYVFFFDPTARQRLTVPILPYSEIERRGAGMYRGQPRAASIGDAPGVQPGEGGSQPTAALQGAD